MMLDSLPHPNASLLHNGAVCAQLAAAAYCGANVIDALQETWGEVRRFENANASGFVGWHDRSKVAFVAIAGTNDTLDAINDLSCTRQPLDIAGMKRQVQVHSGFKAYAEAAVNGLRLLRIKQHLRRKSMFICGHSLGGAAAEIFPLVQAQLLPTQIHTFGSPRWCASEHALDYPYETVHWRRPQDIVPDVPLHLSFVRCLNRVSGFSHVRGQTCWLTESRVDPETAHLMRRAQRIVRYTGASLRGLWRSWRHGWMPIHTTRTIVQTLNQQAASDHLMRDYCRLVCGHYDAAERARREVERRSQSDAA